MDYAVCFRVLFVVMNVFFVLIGAGFTGFGSYLIHLGNKYNFDALAGDQFLAGTGVLASAGGLILITGVIGAAGAVLMWRSLLVIYAVVIAVLVLGNIAAGVTGFAFKDTFVFSWTGNWELLNAIVKALSRTHSSGTPYPQKETAQDTMTRTFLAYSSGPEDPDYDEAINRAVDNIQDFLHCCGVNGSLDWFKHHVDIFAENGLSPPEECLCNPNTFDDCEMVEFTIPVTDNGIFDVSVTARYNAWERGCQEVLVDNIDAVASAIGGVSVTLGVIKISGLIMDIGLLVLIFKASKNSSYPV